MINSKQSLSVEEFDFEDIAAGCEKISDRIADYAISERLCDELGDLERCHDNLANEVANLAALLRETARAIARSRSPLEDNSSHDQQ